MKLSKGHRAIFETLKRAAAQGDLALMDCLDAKTRKPCAVVCAVQRESNGDSTMVPLARLFDGNPYEELLPPDPGSPTGYHEGENHG